MTPGAEPTPERESSSEPIRGIAIPRSRASQVFSISMGLGLAGALWFQMFYALRHDPSPTWLGGAQPIHVTGPTRIVYVLILGVSAPLVLWSLIRFAFRPETEITSIGITRRSRGWVTWCGVPLEAYALGQIWTMRHTLPWDDVLYCRWGKSPPGALNVQIDRQRLFIPVPEPYRAVVEEAIRARGKWGA